MVSLVLVHEFLTFISISKLKLNKKKLKDIDECTSGAANCATTATCTNTQGSFTCKCNAGYSGSGTTCNGKLFQFFIL